MSGVILAHPYEAAAACIALFICCLAALEAARPAYRQSEAGQMRRWRTNLLMGAANFIIAAALPISLVAALEWAQSQRLGLLNMLAAPAWISVPATIMAASFLHYWAHRALHHAPVLWRFHAAHHSDCELDCSTALRHHPGEWLLQMVLILPGALLLGLHPSALAALLLAGWAHDFFAHANLRLPASINSRLALLLVTPNMHALHHSIARQQADSNFGSMFSGWDRLFGTFRDGSEIRLESARFGVEGRDPAHSTELSRMLAEPFQRTRASLRPPEPA